jgi:hypothetical protein
MLDVKRFTSHVFRLTSYFLLLTELLVEVNGFEPMASCVQGRRSPS